MKIMFVVLAALLATVILYFLFNAYFLKQNKLNSFIKLNSRKDAVKYLFMSLLLVPALGFSIDTHMDEMVAQSQGYKSFAALEAETKLAKSYNLSLEEYKTIMKKAHREGFNSYPKYQNHLLALNSGYDNYQTYKIDLQFAKSYGFSLAVYKATKAESDALNYEYFDDYLAYREKNTLKHKLTLISELSGNYNLDSVPLGVNKTEFIELIDDCKISKIPDYSFPVTKTLAPRNKAYVNHFFPATKKTASGFGLTAYSVNFSVMPGLDRQAITKYEMKCETSRYDLWFLNSDDSLVLYEKSITLPERGFEATLTQIKGILTDKCDSDITTGLAMTFNENGTREIKNLYCKNFQDYILATIVDGPIIAGVRQDPAINIGYLNNRLWKKYINNLHTIKNKKRSAEMDKASHDKKMADDRI